jgi:hypothetical protein
VLYTEGQILERSFTRSILAIQRVTEVKDRLTHFSKTFV